ncbi:hypothetical protein [Hymenobacter siberiensis]|uniref:hypothetical protein n=1 Tax=Hymenobacter siberiensis TaxID=2848396 RepID=UPI001C1E1E97|nr:hypothetical protein [Hymenobacter siberiensis]
MAVPSPTPKFQSRRYAMGGPMGDPSQGAPAGPPAMGPPQGAPQGPPPGGDPGADPAAQGGGDPGAQIQAGLQQYAQTKDPQLAVQICDMLVASMAGGGGAPSDGDADNMGGAPAGGPPQMNKKGGKMPAFGKKAMPGAKPAFGAPGKGAPAPAGGKPNPFAKGGAPAGKPMAADQKIRAKREMARFGGKK